VRFTCGNCGRVYVADDRIEGRSFRMRCKRCGHTISVGCAPLPTPIPEKGGPAGGNAVGRDTKPRPPAESEPPQPASALAAAPAADPPILAAGKGKRALLVVIGVAMAAAAGGGTWYLNGPSSRSGPPQAERPREPASAAPASAISLPVEAPARPTEPAAAAQASPPEAAPVAAPAVTTWKAERRDKEKRAPPAPPALARSAAAPASSSRAGPESAAIPATPPRDDLPPRDEQQIQATLVRYARSFDGCVADARRDEPGLLASPRPVVVTMTVRPSGKALYPTLDDAQLTETALGACVKKQSARMVFPESGGEPVPVRMPLLLGG
jgi:predicted Zn finger-like uncharacterized protein